MEAYAHRANARDALRGNWVNAVLVSLLAGIIAGSGLQIEINLRNNEPVQIAPSAGMERFFHEILGIALPVVLMISGVMLVVSLILGGVMELGQARYNLNLIDRRPAEVGDLFSGFPRFLQAMLMNLLRSLLIALGTCLLVIPGIILTYSFALAPYILTEDPDCTGWEALQRSRAMMKGHKTELFWLELTFIGWHLLSALTFGLGSLVLNPYIDASRASFFRDLQNQGYIPVEDF